MNKYGQLKIFKLKQSSSLILNQNFLLSKESKRNCHKVKSSISTDDNSQFIQTPPKVKVFPLYQQYITNKHSRISSEVSSYILNSQINRVQHQHEQKAVCQKLLFFKKPKIKITKRCFNISLEKECVESFREIRDKSIEELRHKNIHLKQSRDLTIKAWKNQAQIKHKNESFKYQLMKHKLDSERLTNNFKDIIMKRESYFNHRIERILSSQHKERSRKFNRENLSGLKNKISVDETFKNKYDNNIIQFKAHGEKLMSVIKNIKIKNEIDLYRFLCES